MPLIPTILQQQLKANSFLAAKEAMNDFISSMYNHTAPLTQEQMCILFANKFSDIFSEQVSISIDSYIKTATITVPPGALIVGVSPSGPVTGATTTATIATIV